MIQSNVMSVNLDWRAYFEDFKEKHGMPVACRGRQVFPDGWSYSLKSLNGPEWRPPTDPEELRSLLLDYWRARRNIVSTESRMLRSVLEGLEELQWSKDGKLQGRPVFFKRGQQIKVRDENSRVGDVDPIKMRKLRLEWLENDLKDCVEKIKELSIERDDNYRRIVG